MKLLSWNVNGLRAVMNKGFTGIVDTLQPDILGIQETKIQEDQLTPEHLELPGYVSLFWSAEKKGYSGVGVYSRIAPLRTVKGFSYGWNDNEGRVIRLEYDDFILFNIYFPNGQKDEIRLQYKLDFYEFCLDYFDSVRRDSGKGLVICGDFNTAHHPIDLARPKQNETTSGFLPVERAWMDRFEARGYADTFRMIHPDEAERYSWWSYRANARVNNVGWRIDYFYVSEDLRPFVKDAYILDRIEGSDHCPVGLELEFKK
ncbi:MAG: exodeoxyribonuclease III [Candidatus Marinimicrobia bacterium]|nr:exodeoxyribonuclease III [Candidatus Neomarinimicrobiota bacterium]